MKRPSPHCLLKRLKGICGWATFPSANWALPRFIPVEPFDPAVNHRDHNERLLERDLVREIIEINFKTAFINASCVPQQSSKNFQDRSVDFDELAEFCKTNNLPSLGLMARNMRGIANWKAAQDCLLPFDRFFAAKTRCITPLCFKYCGNSIVVDHIMFNIKIDDNFKSLVNYIKQVFIQSVEYHGFGSLLSSQRYQKNFTEDELKLIRGRVKYIAIYFLKADKLFKYRINQIMTATNYKAVMDIYKALANTHKMQLLEVMQNTLFENTSPKNWCR